MHKYRVCAAALLAFSMIGTCGGFSLSLAPSSALFVRSPASSVRPVWSFVPLEGCHRKRVPSLTVQMAAGGKAGDAAGAAKKAPAKQVLL
jgi:hypothetical protein